MAAGAATAHEVEPAISVYDRLGSDEAPASVNKLAAGADHIPSEQSDEIDYAVLQDPSHPMFAEMARRFEEKMALEDDDDF